MKLFYLRIALILLVILGIAAIVVIVVGAPQLRQALPESGRELHPGDPLKLTFSQPMAVEQVRQRLEVQPPVPGSVTWQADDTSLVFTPTGGWPAGINLTVTLRSGAQAAAFPYLPQRSGGQWHYYTHPWRFVFLYPNQGPANLYLSQSGRDPARLTDIPGGMLDYSLNAYFDPPRVYYSAASQRGGEIYLLTLPADVLEAGKPLPAPQRVLICPQAACRNVSVAPSGRWLAYERTPFPGTAGVSGPVPQVQYAALDASGAQLQGEARLAGPPDHQTLQPVWSHNDRLAVYDGTDKAYLLIDSAAQKILRQIPNDTGQFGVWQPDGGAFVAAHMAPMGPAYSANSPTGLEYLFDSHLLLYPASGGAERDLTVQPGLEDAAPVFSPDGSQLALARKFLEPRRWTVGRQLWLMHLADGSARPLTDDPVYTHFDLAWSLSGTRLAYVRFNQSTLREPPELWYIDLTSGQTQQVMIGGYAPYWLP